MPSSGVSVEGRICYGWRSTDRTRRSYRALDQREKPAIKLTPRTLLFVFGIPAGYLPLLAAVESSPVEVGVTLFLLTAFGCLEALPLDPNTHEPSRQDSAWRTAKVCCVYAYCLVLGMVVGAATGDSGGSFTPFQNWLSSTVPVHPGLLKLRMRLFGAAVLALVSWVAALLSMSRYRAALWAAFLATPFLSPWHLLIMMFRAAWWLAFTLTPVPGAVRLSGLCLFFQLYVGVNFYFKAMAGLSFWPVLLLWIAAFCIPVGIAARRRPARQRKNSITSEGGAKAPNTDQPGTGQRRPFQFTVGMLLGLTALCALWLSLVYYSSRVPRRGLMMIPAVGTVTYLGKPVADAEVTFCPSNPQSGPQIPSSEVTNSSGAFIMAITAGPGDYVVTINQPAASRTIPARYADVMHSGLKATITKAFHANQFTFDLDPEP